MPLYVNGWVGYRWRLLHEEARRDFADELFFLAQAGTSRSGLGAQVVVEGMRSAGTPLFEGVRVPTAKRRQLQVTPRASWSWGGSSVSIGVRMTPAARNLPAGPTVVAGFFRRLPR